MNTRKTTARRVEEGVVNDEFPPWGTQVPIANQEDVNEAFLS